MTVYDQIIERIKQTCPDKLNRIFRHPNGKLVKFSYAYDFLGEYDGPPLRCEAHIPTMPPELEKKCEVII